MNELALFAGAGGGILGGKLLGWRTVCAVEIDGYCRDRLMQRQDEGHLPAFPIWDDVRTFDGRPWAGCVDIVTGGFPCQDISAAGKGAGITGERSGLWKEMARIIGEVRPRYALVENSPVLTSRGLGVVLGDLAEMGYDARWGVLGAVDAGAPHRRERIWILADADRGQVCRIGVDSGNGGAFQDERVQRELCGGDGGAVVSNSERLRCFEVVEANRAGAGKQRSADKAVPSTQRWWSTEPALGRVAHGVANRVDRLRAIGNGQVPAVVRLAWETLTGINQ